MWTLFCVLPVLSTNDVRIYIEIELARFSPTESVHIRTFHYATIARPQLIVVHGPANGHTAHLGQDQSVHAVCRARTSGAGPQRKEKDKKEKGNSNDNKKDFSMVRELGEVPKEKFGGIPTGRGGQERTGG
jgi:hypothetical protein